MSIYTHNTFLVSLGQRWLFWNSYIPFKGLDEWPFFCQMTCRLSHQGEWSKKGGEEFGNHQIHLVFSKYLILIKTLPLEGHSFKLRDELTTRERILFQNARFIILLLRLLILWHKFDHIKWNSISSMCESMNKYPFMLPCEGKRRIILHSWFVHVLVVFK